SAGRLEAKLRSLKLTNAYASGKLDDILADALWKLTTPNQNTNSIPPNILELAQHIVTEQNKLIARANNAGASIEPLQGRIARQSHDMSKIRRAGLDIWKKEIVPLLDTKTFKGLSSPQEIDDFLNNTYRNLSSGIHLQNDAAQLSLPTRGSNLADRLSAHRKLHFKNSNAFLAYQRKYGEAKLADAILADFKSLANATAFLEKLGPNPQQTFDTLEATISAALSNDLKALDSFNSNKNNRKNLLNHLLGSSDIPANLTIAKMSRGIRAWQNMAKLGGVLLTSISDLAGFSAEARYHGISAFTAYQSALSSLLSRHPQNTQRQIASLIGAGIEGTLGHIHARFDSADPVGTGTAKLMQTFFRLTGLTYWTDALKQGASTMFAHHYASLAHLDFNDLPLETLRIFKLYNINKQDWDTLRTYGIQSFNNTNYLLPDNLPDKLESKYRNLLLDRTDYAVLQPGAREFSILRGGSQAGTPVGEALRFFAQFKTFSVAMTTKTLGREFQGRNSLGETLPNLALFIAQGAILGYLAMSIKDYRDGKKPRSPTDPKTTLAALMQAGGLGIYGDFLLSSTFRKNRYGSDPLTTLLGPTASTESDSLKLYSSLAQYLQGNKENFPAAQAIKLTQQNTPLLNLFYVKPALDYLILHNLQELASPGYLNRLEETLKEDNRAYFRKPSDSLMPLGTP
ncbi:MAG: hypothetical protein HXY23_14300, partial [Parvularculaceae bacterium]|nr:hypothetical protein [Parvularculaceae bacterium]